MEGLDPALIAAIGVSLVVWGLVSARLAALNVSAPMFFVVLGLVLANDPVSAIKVDIDSETLKSLAEVTLALLLFSDAARINRRVLHHDAGVPLRLLVVGLPLTIALGTGIAVLLFPDLDPWAAAAIARGAQVVDDPHVPRRIRRALNVESGLNDGIATPFVTFFIAGAVANTVSNSSVTLGASLGDLSTGVLVGVGVGLAAGLLMTWSATHGWSATTYRGIAALATALATYALAIELGGNGFIGAFVGGLAFGTVVPGSDRDPTLEFDAQSGEFLSLVVWFLFGAAMLPALEDVTWQTVAFAVLALTVARLVPVALVLVGCRFTPVTVAFMGWFGPRGLASVVFALIAFDSLDGSTADVVIAAITLTVLLSVVAHGLTARPFSLRYGAYVDALAEGTPEQVPVPTLGGRPQTVHHAVPALVPELDE